MFEINYKSNHTYSDREFQAPSYDSKRPIHSKDNEGQLLKELRGQLFMGHPLLVEII